MTNSYEYIVSVELPNILQAIEKFLRPQDRGFELVYSGLAANHAPTILYRSSQCQMRIRCRRDRPFDPLEISDGYGRLHAPIDDDIIEWRGEKRHCWHGLRPLLFFLDGLSPTEAVEFTIPRIERKIFESSKGTGWTEAEYFARKHATIWKYYDEQFFDLFDLSNTDPWEKYTAFLKAYYEIDAEKDGTLSAIFNGVHYPYLYKIC